jgi:hypothetical protein
MKKALLIGCNYTTIPSARLYGCINDIINVRNVLIDAYGYKASDIILLRDDINNANTLPTAKNIMDNLTKIIANSPTCEEIWIHYSGHGSNIADKNGDESDRYDEVIIPLDYQKVGVITDDIIFSVIKNSKCKTLLFFDSCNSGSVCDLQWNFENRNGLFVKTMNPNHEISNPNIFMISGCKDSEYANDIYSTIYAEACGSFTNALIECLRNSGHNIGILTLHNNICKLLVSQGYKFQTPVLSSSSDNPIHTFQRKVIIQQVSPPKPNAATTNSTTVVNKTSVKEIHDLLEKNMTNIMINKAHRDPNKYVPKKLL